MPQRYLRGLIGASDAHWRCLRCALDEPPRSLVPLEVSQKSLRGVLEQPWRCLRGLICTFGGALEAPGRCFRRALEAPQKCPGRAMRLNMRLHCASEEPQRCLIGALRRSHRCLRGCVQGPMCGLALEVPWRCLRGALEVWEVPS